MGDVLATIGGHPVNVSSQEEAVALIRGMTKSFPLTAVFVTDQRREVSVRETLGTRVAHSLDVEMWQVPGSAKQRRYKVPEPLEKSTEAM